MCQCHRNSTDSKSTWPWVELNWMETLFLHFLFLYASTKKALIFFYFKSESFHIYSAVKGTRNAQDCNKSFEIRWGKKLLTSPTNTFSRKDLSLKKPKFFLITTEQDQKNLLCSYLSCMLWNFVTARLYVRALSTQPFLLPIQPQNPSLCRSYI